MIEMLSHFILLFQSTITSLQWWQQNKENLSWAKATSQLLTNCRDSPLSLLHRNSRFVWNQYLFSISSPWASRSSGRQCSLCTTNLQLHVDIYILLIFMLIFISWLYGNKWEDRTIPHICHFLYTTAFVRPVNSPPKKCVNFRQNCLATKPRKSILGVLVGWLAYKVIWLAYLVI